MEFILKLLNRGKVTKIKGSIHSISLKYRIFHLIIFDREYYLLSLGLEFLHGISDTEYVLQHDTFVRLTTVVSCTSALMIFVTKTDT